MKAFLTQLLRLSFCLCAITNAAQKQPLKILFFDAGFCLFDGHKATKLHEALEKEYGKENFVEVKLGNGTLQEMLEGTIWHQIDLFDAAIKKAAKPGEKCICVLATQNALIGLGWIESLCKSTDPQIYGLVSVCGVEMGCSELPQCYEQYAHIILETHPHLASAINKILNRWGPHARSAAWLIYSKWFQKQAPLLNYWYDRENEDYYEGYSLGLPYLLNEKEMNSDYPYLPYERATGEEIYYDPWQQKRKLQNIPFICFIESPAFEKHFGLISKAKNKSWFLLQLGLSEKEKRGEVTFETVNEPNALCHHTDKMTAAIVTAVKKIQDA